MLPFFSSRTTSHRQVLYNLTPRTGPSGVVFSEAALALGHKITIYARTPSKLLASVAKHENVHVVQGGLKDDEKVKEVVSSGPTVHASFLGPVLGQTSGTVSRTVLAFCRNSLTRSM